MPNNRINYQLRAINYAAMNNPMAEPLYRDLLLEVMIKKLRKNGKL